MTLSLSHFRNYFCILYFPTNVNIKYKKIFVRPICLSESQTMRHSVRISKPIKTLIYLLVELLTIQLKDCREFESIPILYPYKRPNYVLISYEKKKKCLQDMRTSTFFFVKYSFLLSKWYIRKESISF